MSKLNGKVLLVDDDKDVLFTAELVLKQKFKEVKTETNPKRLLKIVSTFQPDLIFLDMNFAQGTTSGNEGLFWLKELLKAYPTEYVVLNTAYGLVFRFHHRDTAFYDPAANVHFPFDVGYDG